MYKSWLLSIAVVVLLQGQAGAQHVPLKKKDLNIDSLYQKAAGQYQDYEKLHGHFLQTDNVNMHYLSWGDPKNRPLIWAHGSLLNAYELSGVADRISAAGYYLIAIDYYGHGQTPVPEKEVSLYHSADDIEVLMDALKLKKAVIGGFSRGGYIAAAFYQTYPGRVAALVLEDGGSVAFNDFNHKMPEADLRKKIDGVALPPELDSLYNQHFRTERAAYASLYEPEEGGTQFQLLANISKQGEQWVTYAGLMDFFSMRNAEQFRKLIMKPQSVPLYAASITMVQPKIIFRKLSVPVLILDPVSADDPMPFEEENKALAARFPSLITRVEFKGISHNIHYARPEEFTRVLLKFLRQLP